MKLSKPVKLFLLSIAQMFCLGMGIAIISALAPDLPIDNPVLRILLGAAGLCLILFGLQAREDIARGNWK